MKNIEIKIGFILILSITLIVAGYFGFTTNNGKAENTDIPTETLTTLDETILINNDLSIFYNALEKTGLTETLSKDGPYTILAPLNDSFTKDVRIQSLLNDDTKLLELKSLLENHIITGEITFNDFNSVANVQSINSNNFVVSIEDSSIKINKQSTIVLFDIKSSNGIIHVVNSLIQN